MMPLRMLAADFHNRRWESPQRAKSLSPTSPRAANKSVAGSIYEHENQFTRYQCGQKAAGI